MTKLYKLSLIAILLTGCLSPLAQPLGCNQILDEPLRSVPFDEMSEDAFVEWAIDNFNLDPEQAQRYERRPNVTAANFDSAIAWEMGDKYYNGSFIDNELQSIRVDWSSERFSIKELTDCLGAPSHYSALYESGSEVPIVSLYLWYDDEGIIVSAGEAVTSPPVLVSEKAGVDSVTVSRPGSLEDMLRVEDAFNHEKQQEFLAAARPWPGSWEELEVITR